MDTAVGSSVLVRAFRLALSVEGLKPKTISDYVREACPYSWPMRGTALLMLCETTSGEASTGFWFYRIHSIGYQPDRIDPHARPEGTRGDAGAGGVK